MEDRNYTGKEIRLCNDGKYRWVYELNMFKNPTIILTVAKVLGGVIIGMWAFFGLILYVFSGDWEGLWGMTKGMFVAIGVTSVLMILAYLIICWVYGGKYVVLFEMDEKSISHIQLPRQFKRAQAIGLLAALAGAAAHRPSAMGAGFMAASKQATVSTFKDVRKVKAYPGRNLIKVNQPFSKNQVYASPEDFAFVYNWIRSRCPQAK